MRNSEAQRFLRAFQHMTPQEMTILAQGMEDVADKRCTFEEFMLKMKAELGPIAEVRKWHLSTGCAKHETGALLPLRQPRSWKGT